VAGVADELNRLLPKPEIPFEIQPTFEGEGQAKDKAQAPHGRIRLVALRHGKPIPGAVFTAVDSDLTEETVKAGPDGSAVWNPPSAGRYSVYVRDNLKQAGTLDGKAYSEIREFATLAFCWPLERREADSDAVALFEEALAHRAAWREFPGFSAEISGWFEGRPFAGRVEVKSDGSIDLGTDDPVAKPWLKDQLESIVMHRQPPASAADASDPHGPRFRVIEEPSDHPLGKLIAVEGGQMASSYRIKDRQILVVNRRMGKQNMTITVLDNQTNPEGRFLPKSYVVQYWDASSGKLKSSETIQEHWERIGSWDIPRRHSVLTASDLGLSIRVVEFNQPKLLSGR
jgi:hypothetical protein